MGEMSLVERVKIPELYIETFQFFSAFLIFVIVFVIYTYIYKEISRRLMIFRYHYNYHHNIISSIPKRLMSSTISKQHPSTMSNNDEFKPSVSHHSYPSSTPTTAKSNNNNAPFVLSKLSTLKDYLNENKMYVEKMNENHPEIFPLNAQGQSPHTLYIGCSDSRYSEQCVNVLPGEIFVHRNIANVILSHDVSSLGLIQFAIEVLKVKKIIVCGHTDCGGIWASLSSKKIGGVLDQWLYPVRHVRSQHLQELALIKEPKLKCLKLSELNVINSVQQLKRHPSLLNLLKKGEIEVYGLIYDVSNGELRELEIPNDDDYALLFHLSDEDEDEFDPHN